MGHNFEHKSGESDEWQTISTAVGRIQLTWASTRYKKTPSNASEALSRVKAEQRAEARAKMREQARMETGLVDADAIPTNVASVQVAVVQ